MPVILVNISAAEIYMNFTNIVKKKRTGIICFILQHFLTTHESFNPYFRMPYIVLVTRGFTIIVNCLCGFTMFVNAWSW